MARSEIVSNAGRPYIGEPGGTWGSRDCHTNAASVVHKPGGIYSHGRIEVQAPSKTALLHGADRKVVVSAPSRPGPEHLVLRQSLLMSAARNVKADVAKATVDCQSSSGGLKAAALDIWPSRAIRHAMGGNCGSLFLKGAVSVSVRPPVCAWQRGGGVVTTLAVRPVPSTTCMPRLPLLALTVVSRMFHAALPGILAALRSTGGI